MGEPQRGDRVGQLKPLYYGGRKTVLFSTQCHPSFCAGAEAALRYQGGLRMDEHGPIFWACPPLRIWTPLFPN